MLGGILRICGLVMTPRIILMTDGQPTDSDGEEEVREIFSLWQSCVVLLTTWKLAFSSRRTAKLFHLLQLMTGTQWRSQVIGIGRAPAVR